MFLCDVWKLNTLQFAPSTSPSCDVSSSQLSLAFFSQEIQLLSVSKVVTFDQYIPFGHWALIRQMETISSWLGMKFKNKSFRASLPKHCDYVYQHAELLWGCLFTELGFRVRFRVGFSIWIFELGFFWRDFFLARFPINFQWFYTTYFVVVLRSFQDGGERGWQIGTANLVYAILVLHS